MPIYTIPNVMTILRIVAIPILVTVFYLPIPNAREICAILFGIAAVTDWLDGYLARRWQQTSPFGAFLDPVADKLMVVIALILLLQSHPSVPMALSVAVIVGRELTISALREWMAEIGLRASVAVSMLGKFKTTFQMIAVFLLLYQNPIGPIPVWDIGLILLYIAVALTLGSMIVYLNAAWPALMGRIEDQA
ncbi:CDP-diacylglycerol--glycerol-3-phosphate 3-phosphatidyltransferase [Nitrosococcus oceani]|uniref:CDP-diacylglycerol--glycerol-3-phosphate 3-phosphatidyltransferase n=2 Tax=Nitrosococcus oceani TaxID=1229 RepID=Q3JAN1_NITOC|nr:CDP-diacylglycerol--glycerol-3-phosphate 3-phosphatidyltransferase [Nitrosococcus oceani]ABA58115.1 CDP-diacylglycerol--glycerol-3-phosphate 3-phosphatidyltransferase [Nitrosococcus oceani ATCC 19707]KFI19445.1 CDP-diacylglycerol--glycerol-3-phosphate 3-phosphatidyltransferase [Nitrosococcus oceani C-27]KFI22690.1 CDP-diacylglycerol--glycerol-3-phosphate 3-phosphatidyltransferase [Nitrosococcus oceani]